MENGPDGANFLVFHESGHDTAQGQAVHQQQYDAWTNRPGHDNYFDETNANDQALALMQLLGVAPTTAFTPKYGW